MQLIAATVMSSTLSEYTGMAKASASSSVQMMIINTGSSSRPVSTWRSRSISGLAPGCTPIARRVGSHGIQIDPALANPTHSARRDAR